MRKWINALSILIIIVALAVPAVSYGAANQLQEAEDYLAASAPLLQYASKAMAAYDNNRVVTADNRKERYKAFAYTIVPNYKKFYQGIAAMEYPDNMALLVIHKTAVHTASQQLQAFTAMKNALYKNPMDKKTYNEAKKIIESTKPELANWTADLNAYHEAVTARNSTPKLEISPEPAVFPRFHASVSPDDMFEDLKPVSAYLIQLFADALKYGSDDKMAAWLKDNLGTDEDGNDLYEECLSSFNTTIHNYNQAYNDFEITTIIDSAMVKAKEAVFNELSAYTGGSRSRTFDYYLNASNGNYEAIIGVHLNLVLNEDTHYYDLSSVSFD